MMGLVCSGFGSMYQVLSAILLENGAALNWVGVAI